MTTTRFFTFLPVLLAALVFYFILPTHGYQEPSAQSIPNINIPNLATPPITIPNVNITIPGLSAGTPAAGNLSSVDSNGQLQRCSDLPQAKGGVMLGKIIPCLIHTIESTTQSFSQKMITMLNPMFYAFLTLVITLFGVKVLQGEHQLNSQAFLLVLKIAFVVGIMQMIPNTFVPATYGIISDGVNIVSDTIAPNSSKFHCDVESYGDANTPKLWKQMDCVLGKLYGFATGKGNTGPNGSKPVNMLMASSAIGLMTGFFFSGTLGVTVFFALIGVLWSIMMLVLRVALAFMNGYLIVCILLILAPIFLPLTLLKATSPYFDTWTKAILGGLLLPVLVTAYTMFALLMYDRLLFAPDSKLQHLFSSTEMTDALQQSRKLCDDNITNDPTFKGKQNASKTELDTLFKSNPFLQNFAQPLLSGSSDMCSMLEKPVLDVTKIKSPEFENQGQRNIMLDLFKQCIELFIMAFLVAEGVETVQNVTSSLTSSSLSRQALNSRSQLETRIGGEMDNAKRRIMGSFALNNGKSATGAEFVKRIPQAGRAGIGDFLSSLVDKR